ncbi:MAG: aminotransferase class V-fold PLP-dependent enzyme [Methylococcales bacterium]
MSVLVKITSLRPDSDGRLSLASVLNALTDETILVSLMHANNETGNSESPTSLIRQTIMESDKTR